jgi:hypothetical protein
VEILGFDPNKARPGDIVALSILHSKFFTRGVVWLKVGNDGFNWT